MAEVSRQSRVRFRRDPLFWIPAHFYEAMHRESFSPSLHQLFALSVLTNYRLADWVRVFGFSFDMGARFQAAWLPLRTAELDSRIYHPEAEIAWFDEVPQAALEDELLPLNRWLSGIRNVPVKELAPAESRFRYFKVGSADAYAYPDLLPGSIVRVNPHVNEQALSETRQSRQIMAVEHALGVTCSYVRRNGAGNIILCSKQLPYPPVELSFGRESRILGVVDLEIRRLTPQAAPTVSAQSARQWSSKKLDSSEHVEGLGEYLRRARLRSSLSFHAASERSKEIAHVLKHPNYFCASSFLSDIEASGRFPRHVHKLISLSALYGVSPIELAVRAGLSPRGAGMETMPVGLAGSAQTRRGDPSRFLRAVEDRFEEIPFFLRSALPSLIGLPHLSIRDVFWAGTTNRLTHPYLRNAAFLAVNRKSKRPAPLLSSPLWAQPLYLIELRNGRLLCAACTLHEGTLWIRPCTATGGSPLRLRNHVEVQVLGKVVALVRSL
jgi:hypothetical protein